MTRHDPGLAKAHEANRQAIALANVSETAIRNFEAMTVGERRYQHEVSEMQAIRHSILAGRKCNAEFADYLRECADGFRRTAAALKAVGL